MTHPVALFASMSRVGTDELHPWTLKCRLSKRDPPDNTMNIGSGDVARGDAPAHSSSRDRARRCASRQLPSGAMAHTTGLLSAGAAPRSRTISRALAPKDAVGQRGLAATFFDLLAALVARR